MANVNVSPTAWPGSLYFIFCYVFFFKNTKVSFLGIMLHFRVYNAPYNTHAGNIEKAAEVQIIVPLIGQNNSHTFVVQTYDKSEVNDYYNYSNVF